MALTKDPVTGQIVSVPDSDAPATTSIPGPPSTTSNTATSNFLAKDNPTTETTGDNQSNEPTGLTDENETDKPKDDGGLTPQMKTLIGQATEFNKNLEGSNEAPPTKSLEGDLPSIHPLDIGAVMKRIDIVLRNNCSDSSSQSRASQEIRTILSEI